MSTPLPKSLLQELPKPSPTASRAPPKSDTSVGGAGGTTAHKSLLLNNDGGLRTARTPADPRGGHWRGVQGTFPGGAQPRPFLALPLAGAGAVTRTSFLGRPPCARCTVSCSIRMRIPTSRRWGGARAGQGGTDGAPPRPLGIPQTPSRFPLTFFSFCCWITRSFFGAMVRPVERVAGLTPQRSPGPPHWQPRAPRSRVSPQETPGRAAETPRTSMGHARHFQSLPSTPES